MDPHDDRHQSTPEGEDRDVPGPGERSTKSSDPSWSGTEELEAELGAADDQVHEDLLLDFQRGDPDAFNRIVGRYEAPLWRFFYRLCWDRERAEDFVQDVFLRVYRSSSRYQPRGRLSTFLYRIATNRWIDHWRSMRPRPTLFSLDGADRDEESPILDRVASDVEEPSADLEKDHEKARLRLALERLTLPHRLVFELAVYQNLPYPQIAELLDIPVGTVKSRMHNTTKVLRELLKTEEDEEEDSGRPRGDRRSRPTTGRRRNRA